MTANVADWPVETWRAGASIDRAERILLLLHGRGAGAADILSLGQALGDERTMLIAPQAPGRTWYPYSFLEPIERNEPCLSASLRVVDDILSTLEARGHSMSAVALCGFSQGACLASEYVARHPRRYRALLAFTGGLIGSAGATHAHRGDLAGTPVLLSSGDPDPHVPWERVKASGEQFVSMGARVEETRYPGRPHVILPQEIAAARILLGG